MNISVVYSLPTRRSRASKFADTDVDTVESAEEVARALEEKGARVARVPVDEDHINEILTIRADLIFNLIEWTGLDMPLVSQSFAAYSKTGIPVTGATYENYVTTADKVLMKKLFEKFLLPTARWQVFATGKEKVRPDFRYPVIIKPSLEHCSIGLTADAIVHDETRLAKRIVDHLKQLQQPMRLKNLLRAANFR